MAKAKLLERPKDVPFLTLELSQEESQFLYDLVGKHITGNGWQTQSIYYALKDAAANEGLNTDFDRDTKFTGEVRYND